MMSKKFEFISGLDEKPKIKYQIFEVVMGFEHTNVLIPFDRVNDFQEEALIKQPKSSASLKKLAEKFGGMLDVI